MKVIIEIDPGHEAFKVQGRAEVVRILRQLAQDLEANKDVVILRNINGDPVGRIFIGN